MHRPLQSNAPHLQGKERLLKHIFFARNEAVGFTQTCGRAFGCRGWFGRRGDDRLRFGHHDGCSGRFGSSSRCRALGLWGLGQCFRFSRWSCDLSRLFDLFLARVVFFAGAFAASTAVSAFTGVSALAVGTSSMALVFLARVVRGLLLGSNSTPLRLREPLPGRLRVQRR